MCQKELYNQECCWDMGDCDTCITCDPDLVPKLGDDVCNDELNLAQCCYDAGDCEEYIWESKHMNKGFWYGGDKYHVDLHGAGMRRFWAESMGRPSFKHYAQFGDGRQSIGKQTLQNL